LDSEISDLTVPGFSGRPALAVVHFENLAGDPQEDYFAEGVAEDLITRLSSWRHFPVIARNSSFFFRSPVADRREVGRELGVQYLLEGSVRRTAESVGISAKLSDATVDRVIWKGKHEREVQDIFSVLDVIGKAVVEAIEPGVSHHDPDRFVGRVRPKLDAWQHALRGIWHMNRLTQKENTIARSYLEKAAELDPHLVLAHWGLVNTHYLDLMYEWTASPEETLSETIRVAEIGATLDARDPLGHLALALAHGVSGRREEAIASLELTIQLNPSLSLAYYLLGWYLTMGDGPDAGLPMLRTAMRLSPLDPEIALFMFATAVAHFSAERYEEAAEWARKSIQRRSDWSPAYRVLASSYAHLGRIEDARQTFTLGRRLHPKFTESTARMLSPNASPDLVERFFGGLRMAGWQD
jgi:adenylate cyclase